MLQLLPPTDATAGESVTHGLKVPRKVAYYLRNESLFNDASGLILLAMMVSWYVNKNLVIIESVGQLFISVVGGIVLGIISSLLLAMIRQKTMQSSSLDNSNFSLNTPVQIAYLMTPFLLYFLLKKSMYQV